MKFMHIVWKNLMRRKIRTIFTLLSIFVAFVLFGFLMAVRSAFSMGIDLAGADRLMVLNKISIIMPLPVSYKDRIKQIEGVKEVTYANWFGGYFQETKNQFPNMAVDSENWFRMYGEFSVPDDQMKAWLADRQGAIIGADLAKRFGWKVGDRVPLQATIFARPDRRAWEFNISGIYDSPVKGTDKTQLFFHWEMLNEVLRESRFGNQVGWYVIKVTDPEQSAAISKTIDTMFANAPTETKTDSEKNFVAGWAKQIGNIGLMTQLIAAAAIFMMLLVTANTMAQSIRERTSELAVLKTLGYNDRRVLTLVLAESCVLALVGGVAGIAVAWTFVTVVGDPTGSFLPQFFFPTKDVVLGILMVVALGFAAGAIPALQAQRLRIVDALRRT
ncbi:MAG TPA: FtsX-like permease family protein [Vicinamibacterales bacterium]|nr:FtsX-like permease family protein [Vicinamibacterales bacterium]